VLHPLCRAVAAAGFGVALGAGSIAFAQDSGLNEAFQGHFVPQFQSCDGPNRIEISADRIATSFGVMKILRVGTYSAWPEMRRVVLADEGGYSGQIRLVLAPDEQSMRVYFRDGTEITWNRCL
jgi:hypothetical protein